MVINAVLRIVVLATLARLLAPHDFGVITAAMVAIDFSMQFTEMGLSQALIQRRDIDRRHIAAAISSSLVLGMLFAALYYSLAQILASFFGISELYDVVRVLCILLLLNAIKAPGMAILQRSLSFRHIFGLEIGAYVFGYALVAVSCALAGFGYWSLIAGTVCEALLTVIAVIGFGRRSLSIGFDRAAFGDLWRFGAAQTVSSLAGYFVVSGDKFIVGRYLGTSDLGVYGRAYQLMSIPNHLFSQAIGRVLFPAMARAQQRPERIGAVYEAILHLTLVCLVPAMTVGLLFPDEIVQVLLGDQWRDASGPLQVLLGISVVRLASKIGYVSIKAMGVITALTWISVLHAILVVGLSWLAVGSGITMVAFAIGVAAAVDCMAATYLVCRVCKVGLRRLVAGVIPIVIGGALLTVILLVTREMLEYAQASSILRLLAAGFVSALVSTVGVWFFGQRILGGEARAIIRDFGQMVAARSR